MKVTVKLFGTLGDRLPGYVQTEGIEVEIPDGGRVSDLLSVLPEMLGSRHAVVAAEGRILTLQDVLKEGACVNLLQPLGGG